MSGGYESIYRFTYESKKYNQSLEVTAKPDGGLSLTTRSAPIDSVSAMDEKVSTISIPKAEKAKFIKALVNNQLSIKF